MICASIPVTDTGSTRAAMASARKAGADLCELRLDHAKDPDVTALLADRPLPVLATVRPKWEGGRFEGSEADRLALLEAACLAGADYVDVEFRAYKDFNRRQAKLVLSYHDFTSVPDDLEATVAKMKAMEPFLVKVACMPAGGADLARLVRLQKGLGVPGAVMGMGDYGEPLRILHARYGGFLAYAATEAGNSTAPGQLTVAEMVKDYRVASIDDATEIYGVVGNPVGHSKSPALFNDCFRHLGTNARYVKVRLDDGAALRDVIEAMELRGVSVTIPHKEAAARVVDERDDVAAAVGALNTVVARDGKLTGSNTDVPAAIDTIKAAAVKKLSHGIYGLRALVLGAGGVARAVAWGLKREAARVVIANRTFERARALAEELKVETLRWSDVESARPQIVVNGTSVGMVPDTEASPVPASFFTREMVVLDTVYTPRRTRFLRDAAAAGAATVDGVEMFLGQADLQFRAFRDRKMPAEVVKEYRRKL